MFDTILIPTDGSADARRGAERGVELAATVGATVHALYVVEEGTNPWSPEPLEEQLDRAREYGDEVTAEVVQIAADAGVECVTATAVGPRVSEEIDDYVEEEDIDAIVMGSGFRGSMGALLGSTTDKVLRMARVPVMVVRRR